MGPRDAETVVANVSAYDSTSTSRASNAHDHASQDASLAARAGVAASRSFDDGSSAAAASRSPTVAAASRSTTVRTTGRPH